MEYAASHIQIKMLRLKSETVRQNITYNCFNTNRKLKVLTDDEVTMDMDDVITSVKDGCKNVCRNFFVCGPFLYLFFYRICWNKEGEFRKEIQKEKKN